MAGLNESREAIEEFVRGIASRSYHDEFGHVFADGRGFWNFYLPREIGDAVSAHCTQFHVVQDFVQAVITWQASYRKGLVTQHGDELSLIAFVEVPILTAMVQLLYTDAAEALCFDFYRRKYGELTPITHRTLTENLGLVRSDSVSEIGFRFWHVDKPSVEVTCGEVWILGDVPNRWMQLWYR